MPGKVRSDTDGSSEFYSKARLAEQALQFIRYCAQWEKSQRRMSVLRSVSLYPPSTSRNGSWLVIGKAWSDGQRLVAFYRSTDPLTALLGFFTAVAAEKVTWKPDQYANE